MTDRENQILEEFLGTLSRLTIMLIGTFLVLVLVTGCSADSERSRAIDLAVKGSYTPGETIGTRNQIPQGGTDEKSGSTPTMPSD